MKPDSELISLCAIAMGLNIGTDEGSYDDLKWFNPLRKRLDAFSVMVKLQLDVGRGRHPGSGEDIVLVSHADKFPGWFEEEIGEKEDEAYMRAITRAGAYMGEMKNDSKK